MCIYIYVRRLVYKCICHDLYYACVFLRCVHFVKMSFAFSLLRVCLFRMSLHFLCQGKDGKWVVTTKVNGAGSGTWGMRGKIQRNDRSNKIFPKTKDTFWVISKSVGLHCMILQTCLK